MLLNETKIRGKIYYHNWLGYDVVCSTAVTTDTGGSHGWVGLVVRELPQGWNVESTRFHGTNVVSCKVVSGDKQTPLVGSPPPPHSTLEHLPYMEEALSRFWDKYSIVLGDLNAYIGQAQNPRSQQVADLLI